MGDAQLAWEEELSRALAGDYASALPAYVRRLVNDDRQLAEDITLAGVYPGGRCSLVAHSRDGQSDTAASWADTHGTAAIDGATAIPASQLSELDVVTDRGELLVRITLPRRGD